MIRTFFGLVLTVGVCSLSVGCGGGEASTPEDEQMSERRAPAEKRGAPGTALGQSGTTDGDAPEGEAPPPAEGGG